MDQENAQVPRLGSLILNMFVAGLASFFVVSIIVFLSTFVAPVWILLATAFPTSILVVLLVMKFSKIEYPRMKGTLVAYALGLSVLAMTVVTWALISQFFFQHLSPLRCIWLSFLMAMVVWVCLSLTIGILYLNNGNFKRLLSKGSIYE